MHALFPRRKLPRQAQKGHGNPHLRSKMHTLFPLRKPSRQFQKGHRNPHFYCNVSLIMIFFWKSSGSATLFFQCFVVFFPILVWFFVQMLLPKDFLKFFGTSSFFFSASALWPVWRSVNCLGQKKSCTGPFNWSEAHCAGENVKRRAGPFLWKSLRIQTRTKTQHGAQPATATRNPSARLPGARTEKQPKQTRDFKDNSRYALTYIEVPWSML